jgi:hypothetical protein
VHELPQQWNKIIKVLRQNPEWQRSSTGDAEYQKYQRQVMDWLLNDESDATGSKRN